MVAVQGTPQRPQGQADRGRFPCDTAGLLALRSAASVRRGTRGHHGRSRPHRPRLGAGGHLQRPRSLAWSGGQSLCPAAAMTISDADRQRLIRILGMLGSEHAGERATAALQAEAFRRRHNLTWTELLASGAQAAPRWQTYSQPSDVRPTRKASPAPPPPPPPQAAPEPPPEPTPPPPPSRPVPRDLRGVDPSSIFGWSQWDTLRLLLMPPIFGPWFFIREVGRLIRWGRLRHIYRA